MRDTKNKKQGYSCGFFQAIVDCFSQCCKKKSTQNQSFFYDYAEGLFGDSRADTSNYHELEASPCLVLKTQTNAANKLDHVKLPKNEL